MANPYELITLKDGSQIPSVAIGPILLTLRDLLEKQGIGGVIACYELRELCRNPKHQLFGSSGDMLKEFALVDINGVPHDITRSVVLNAVVGEELDMTLRSPLDLERQHG